MRILGIIPARFASSRFPGKPLVDILGKTMIRRVYEQAKKTKKLEQVIVATDNRRIYDEVIAFGGEAMMTDENHLNGTERCNEVVNNLADTFDYAINIQGDEPYIQPEMIDELASILDGNTELGTLVKTISDPEILTNPNSMKVVLNKKDEAMYFSRSCIPFVRGADPDQWLQKHTFYKHIGIYAYRVDILKQITDLEATSLELAESLEQLRWLENGLKIKVAKTDFETHGVDTPEDLIKLEKLMTDG
ncbi:MAG: 3-deoxy-manno-octulosonate cytidylyltransferase [Bacteroidota bacterium]